MCGKFICDTFQKANNKGADQSAWVCRLVCAFVVLKPQRPVFLHQGPYYPLQVVNSKGAYDTAQFCRLVCTFVTNNSMKSDFLVTRPNMKQQFNVGIYC